MTANQLKWLELQENIRANQAKEAENYRSNVAKEAENVRHNTTDELLNRDKYENTKTLERIKLATESVKNFWEGMPKIRVGFTGK